MGARKKGQGAEKKAGRPETRAGRCALLKRASWSTDYNH